VSKQWKFESRNNFKTVLKHLTVNILSHNSMVNKMIQIYITYRTDVLFSFLVLVNYDVDFSSSL